MSACAAHNSDTTGFGHAPVTLSMAVWNLGDAIVYESDFYSYYNEDQRRRPFSTKRDVVVCSCNTLLQSGQWFEWAMHRPPQGSQGACLQGMFITRARSVKRSKQTGHFPACEQYVTAVSRERESNKHSRCRALNERVRGAPLDGAPRFGRRAFERGARRGMM